MKIILNPVEAIKMKEVAKTLQAKTEKLNDVLGIPTGEEASLADFFNGCKFANVQIGVQGVTINIDPAFVVDFCKIYGSTICVVGDHVISLVHALQGLEVIHAVQMAKWA